MACYLVTDVKKPSVVITVWGWGGEEGGGVMMEGGRVMVEGGK